MNRISFCTITRSSPQPRSIADRVASIILQATLSCVDALPTRHSIASRDALARARRDLDVMRRAPVQLVRPVVVLNGYHGWWGLASTVRDGLREATGSNNIICVSYAHRCSLAAAAQDVRAALAKHLGDDYASGRGAFDCVGISMGGIVASALAAKGASDEDERVLRAARAGEPLAVTRVFTLGTPHRGAMLAERVRPDLAARELCAGSPVLQALQRAVTAGTTPKPYCFAQTRDAIVGMHNARPRGVRLQRMPGPVIGSHFTSARNPVFWAAIARELRGETSV